MEPIKTFSQWGRLKNHDVLSLPPSLPTLSVLQLGAIHMTLADINNRSMKDTARSISLADDTPSSFGSNA